MATKEGKHGPNMNFAFGKKNYTYLIGGILLLIIGFVLLAGGGSKDPNQFSNELFSTQRMVVAPILLMLGYIVVAVAILAKPDGEAEETQSEEQQ
jgi:hypothetical protein